MPSALLVPPCGAWWGAYVERAGNESVGDAVARLESSAGRKLDVVYTYHDMDQGSDGTLLTDDERTLGATRLLMLSWSSSLWAANSRIPWRDIASGSIDASVIDVQAARIRDYGKPLMLAFDPEMDSRAPRSGTSANYVAAYHHIHDRFAALGVKNVIWVWTTTGYLETDQPRFASFYPGDTYVDWIGFDQYNYFTCHNTDWQSFTETEQPTYDWLQAHGFANKPLMLAEYSSAADPAKPQAQAAWYEAIPSAMEAMPGVKAVVQWDAKVTGPDCDLTLTNPDTMAAFAAAGRNPYFHQPLP